MPFTLVGIQDNLPVLPVHVLQIIQSLTQFDANYSTVEFYRQGRTNFGGNAFTSSAHVEMHNYDNTDPLVIYSGPDGDDIVLKVDTGGSTTLTSLTASNATITTLSTTTHAATSSTIGTATINTVTVNTATIQSQNVQNSTVNSLLATQAFLGSVQTVDSAVTNETVTNLTATTASISYLTASSAILTGSLLGTASNATIATSIAPLIQNVSVTGDLSVAGNVSVTGESTFTGNTRVAGTSQTTGSVDIRRPNVDFTNTNGQNSHIRLVNPDAAGQTVISSIINNTLTGKIRNDFGGSMTYVATGTGIYGYHLFTVKGDASGVNALFISSSGAVGINTTTPAATLTVNGNVTATSVTSSLLGTASYATQALTASYILGSGGSATPGGSNTQIQYNNNGTIDGVPTLRYDGTNLVATGSFSGSFVGNLAGTASFVSLTAGPGITVNGLQVTASVQTVNGISPVNGNVAVSLAGVLTGLSSSNYNINLVASSSGAITASFTNGALWVVSAETGSATSGSNGQVFIYQSGSVGRWLRVAPLDTAAADARYLLLAGGTMGGSINMGGNNATNAGTWQGTAHTASFVTASSVRGPLGISSVASSSVALTATTASYMTGSVFTSTNPALSASYALTASFVVGGASATIGTLGNTIYSVNPATANVAYGQPVQYRNIFIGSGSGEDTGLNTSDPVYDAIQVGTSAGALSTGSYETVFIGSGAGRLTKNNYQAVAVGAYAGLVSHFSDRSVFIGPLAGYFTRNARHSILIGDSAGYNTSNLSIGSNNIVIGNGITLPSGSQNSINIGAVLFATGTFDPGAGYPTSFGRTTAAVNPRVGIGTSNPIVTLDVSGSGRFTNTLSVTGSLQVAQSGSTGGFGGVITKLTVPRAQSNALYLPPNTTNLTLDWDQSSFIDNRYNLSAFPALRTYAGGAIASTVTDGTYTMVRRGAHLGIGTNAISGSIGNRIKYLEGFFMYTDEGTPNRTDPLGDLPIAKTSIIISDNITLLSNANGDVTSQNVLTRTANGRDHVLSVTGSFLARDGVSLGTNLANQHYITGSITMTGSMVVNSGQVITNGGDTFASTAAVRNIVTLTSAEYTALATKDANTLYVVI